MAWYEVIILLICGLTVLILIIGDIKKEVKLWRNQIPDGKDFVNKFNTVVSDIAYACSDDTTPLPCWVNGIMFKVYAKKINNSHLNYNQMYKCFEVWVNGELVCREHIIHKNCKDYIYFEFTDKRKKEEIVDIVNEAHKPAREIIDKKKSETPWLNNMYKSYFKENKF